MNIILVHGILGFRSKFGLEYFRGVAEHLREKGFRVLAPTLDPTQGIIFRANQLRDQINQAMANRDLDPAQKSHSIAHSMGGLDSRWMLSPVNPDRIQSPIRSLTTISTPHLGSPIADIVDSPEKLRSLLEWPIYSSRLPRRTWLTERRITTRWRKTTTWSGCWQKFT